MTTVRNYAGVAIEVDSEGFVTHPERWNEEMAAEIAAELGIERLSERHWQAIRYVRQVYEETGSTPALRTVGKSSGVPIRELYELFPKGPALRQVARIAGVPKPSSCV
jgi:TusE/DsrC/DsvC family sulfur relay protein